MHTMHTKEPFYCNNCDFQCLDEQIMQDHVHKTHKPTRTFFTQSRTPRPSLIPNPESRTKKTVRTQSRPFPPAATSGIISTSSEESSGRSTTTPPASVSENFQFLLPCNQCRKTFSAKDEIELHMQYYHGQTVTDQ